MSNLTIKWSRSASSEEILKYEIRRINNPDTTPVEWGNGIKLGETTDTQFTTTDFPFDIDFAIMVASWDGYKWSEVDQFWEDTIDRPVVIGDLTNEGGDDLSGGGYPGTGTGWTTGTDTLSTDQTAFEWTLESGNWTAATDTWFGTDQTQNNPDKPEWIYTPPVVDIGFGSEWILNPDFEFDIGQTDAWDDAQYPWGKTNTKTPELITTVPPRERDYTLIDEDTNDGPPDDNWIGNMINEIPLEIKVKYSIDNITWTDWLPFTPGRTLFLRYYQFQFIWRPYFWDFYFTFNRLIIRLYRRNRKIFREVLIASGTVLIDFQDENGDPYLFLQKPTVQLTSRTPGIAHNIAVWQTDGNGLYTGVTVTGYDISTGAVTGSGSQVNIWVDGF